MTSMDTPHLRLVPLELEVAEAIIEGARPPGEEWAHDYPSDATLVAASIVVAAAREGGDLGPWTAFQIRRRDTGMAIGGVGYALGPPGHDGAVQVTYSIVPSQQGRGYGREAVRAAVEYARAHGVERVVAETAATNDHGIGVFEGAGMRRSGEQDGIVFFEA